MTIYMLPWLQCRRICARTSSVGIQNTDTARSMREFLFFTSSISDLRTPSGGATARRCSLNREMLRDQNLFGRS